MATAAKTVETAKIKTLLLDPKRVNDPELLKQWDDIWNRVNEMREIINSARKAAEDVTVEMMYKYEQARNAERQFFWDHFYDQSETNE